MEVSTWENFGLHVTRREGGLSASEHEARRPSLPGCQNRVRRRSETHLQTRPLIPRPGYLALLRIRQPEITWFGDGEARRAPRLALVLDRLGLLFVRPFAVAGRAPYLAKRHGHWRNGSACVGRWHRFRLALAVIDDTPNAICRSNSRRRCAD